MNRPKPDVFRIGSQEFYLTERTLVMGVLNVTPDSFSDGGRFLDPDAALRQAERMIEEGVDIIDVGGESSRPAGPYGDGAERVSEEEETRRTAPIISEIVRRFGTPISIDTVKPSVARSALDAGATAVNDISGLADPATIETAVLTNASVFIMHMKGTPKTMQRAPRYQDLVGEIMAFLRERAEQAEVAGIPRDRIAIDPGLGFGKSYEDNYGIIRSLDALLSLGYPLLVGPSRKTFVGLDYELPPEDREEGSLAAFALCAAAGAHLIRAHDVKGARRALFVADRFKAGEASWERP